MNIKTIFLSIIFNVLPCGSTLGVEIAIAGMSVDGINISTTVLETFAKEESRKLTEHKILDDHDMIERLGTNPEIRNNSCRRLYKLGNSLQVDYLLTAKLRMKDHRMCFRMKLLDISSKSVSAENELFFALNYPQIRRMVRICLRDLFDYFDQINHPITPLIIGAQNKN